MAYVYNQNQDEQQQQGSNIFAPQPQDGQGQQGQPTVDKTAPSGTLSAGVGAPLGGKYRGTEKTGAEISQQSAQQRQARMPLQEIYRRNQPGKVNLPDFNKITQQIKGAQESAQAQADAYKAAQLNRFTKLTEQDIAAAAEGQPEIASKISQGILPQQLQAEEFKLDGAQLPDNLDKKFRTSEGLQSVLRKQPGAPTSAGELNLDVSLLQRSPEFQMSRDQVLQQQQAAEAQRNKLLQETQTEAQKLLDPEGEAAKKSREANLQAMKEYAENTLLEPGKMALQAERDKELALQKQISDYEQGLGPMPDILRQQIYQQGMSLVDPRDLQRKQFMEQYLSAPQQKSTFDPYLQRLRGLEMASGLEALSLDPSSSQGSPFLTMLGQYDASPEAQLKKSLSVKGVPTEAQASQYLTPEQFTKFQRLQTLLGTPATATPEMKPTSPQLQINQEALRPYTQRAADWYQKVQDKLSPVTSAKQSLASLDAKIADQSGRTENMLMGKKGSEFYNQFQKATQGLPNVAKAALALKLQYERSPDALAQFGMGATPKGPNFAAAAKQFGISEERVRKAYGALG